MFWGSPVNGRYLVSDDETTVERTARADVDESTETTVSESDAAGASEPDPPRSETEFDRAAESFLELESDLDGLMSDDDVDVGQFRGVVVDADRVDADAVPQGYPVDVRTDRALALRVDRGGEETTVYLA